MTIEKIGLEHGSGGQAMFELVTEIFQKRFANEFLMQQNDGALIGLNGGRIAMTTDSFVVDPIFFPGGDIGSLAVNGTVNDLAMCGARPLYLTAGFIIEEGLPAETLERVADSMAEAAGKAGVMIVAGDTKVVPSGKADKLFINTAGVGAVDEGVQVGGQYAKPGDAVLISGTIADHGIAVMCQREGLRFENEIKSDCAALNGLVREILTVCPETHVLRDPTRGGVATTLNEIARQSKVGIRLYEEALPYRGEVLGACDLLGLDPLYVANEGKLLAVVPAGAAAAVLSCMRHHPLGQDAAVIGEVMEKPAEQVLLRTRVGGHRILNLLRGEQLPRIC